jgi:hypothetical protein
MFSFYHKIHNTGKSYGIYTLPLQDIWYGCNLCPTTYNQHTFTDLEYSDMAAILYEKLLDVSVIPLQYKTLRNIIDRYAEDNDGFATLYELMEDTYL